MIEGIDVPRRTPFDREDVMVDGLQRVNFFFGPNGSGKTTLSRVIDESGECLMPGCIRWTNGEALKTYVYNRDFNEKNFSQSNDVPGVFTIGKDAKETQERIDKLKREIERSKEKIAHVRENLRDAESHLEEIDSRLSEMSWDLKLELPQSFKHAWTGAVKKKNNFRDKLIGYVEKATTAPEPCTLEELQRRAEIVYDEGTQRIDPMYEIDFASLSALGESEVLGRIIVGSEDVPIARIIKSLGNSDWVASGRKYIKGSPMCPFCQKATIDDEFRGELERYFDESYQVDLRELRSLASEYNSTSQTILRSIGLIHDEYAEYVNGDRLAPLLERLKGLAQSNQSQIWKKVETPSLKIEIKDTSCVCKEIGELLGEARTKIEERNDMIANRSSQKAALDEDIWRYCASKANARLQSLLELKRNETMRSEGLNAAWKAQEERQRSLEEKLSEAEKNVTNVRETASVINNLLEKLGFTTFVLQVSDDERSYRIVRSNGEPAMQTLSEGETSFLTFLYFYQLASGSQEPSGASTPRVIVIDDPISSMDSDVLFVVSSLVRGLAADARRGEGLTRQLIVLTHNMTFHKEITYCKAGEGDAKTSYYVIRKRQGYSTVERCDRNPITSTYEQLWEELFQNDCSPLTAQNVARRIVETFFSLMGEPKADNVIRSLKGADLEVARSFMSWANAGSHVPFDDETFVNTTATTENYRRVLETIFKCSSYGEHYDHMLSLVGKIKVGGQ